MNTLLIALSPDTDTGQPLNYLLLCGDELVDAGCAPASKLPRLEGAGGERVALAPPRALSWHQLRLPPGIDAQSPRLRAVLEGLLEDQLLDPPEQLHLVLAGEPSAQAAPEGVWVAACDRRWLAMAVQGLEAAGCALSRVLPEWGPPGELRVHITGSLDSAQLVLCSPGSISVLPFTPEALAWALPPGQPAQAPLSAEPELADWASQQLGQPVQAWPRSQRWALAARPRWSLAQGLRMRQPGPRSPLQWLQAPRWRGARWALLALGGVNLLGLNLLAGSQRLQLRAQQTQMQQVLQQTFPQAAPVDDPLAQMARELDRLRQASTEPQPGDLGTMLGAVLPLLPGGRLPEALDHTPGQLRIQGLALSAPELQSLAERLGPQGYRVSNAEGQLQVQRQKQGVP